MEWSEAFMRLQTDIRAILDAWYSKYSFFCSQVQMGIAWPGARVWICSVFQ